ncbi:hypothetical protein CNMCM5793_001603 [Aspergillus hiratsukae]|uniref:non-reducing end alpha-L-arabinofuranosidase n=1 Tax=Aspergillus hiratsukae TaxID=1194566 RepID=A0A8H6Q206_9EURO|nr:hypothetical protein CNMCM5793_001603 [Aspergillus hiratsukae]KAF7164121.1 hypothetical protein CNMCM6106_000779 [Aspergillus hiratsukae]
MKSFTKIKNEETPSIELSPTRIISDIDPMIYGGFLEHMGRCIYGGIYDPDNKHGLVDENGFRTDVIECLKELKVPVLRYPGGNFVATYHWMDGIGPREKRPKRNEPAWLTEESNAMGTDEYMKFCEIVGTEPYLALNMGTGTLDEALAWLEYCNSDKDTYYANLRRANGHEKPYNVKYWALGNETWGPWQVEQLSKEDYAKKAFQWGKAFKLLDPTITLILCGKTGYDDWDRYVLQECIQYTDMHSIHLYTCANDHLANVTSPLSAERAIEITSSLISLAFINHTATYTAPNSLHYNNKTRRQPPKICFDEWNMWDEHKAPGHLGGEQAYDLSDALGLAVWLNVFVRQSKHIGMANIAQSVNVLGPLSTKRDGSGVVKQTLWWPLLLFCKYMRGKALGVHWSAGTYEGKTRPEWIRDTEETPWLDVSAALDEEENIVNLAVVNISEDKDWGTDLHFVTGGSAGKAIGGGEVQVFTVGGPGTNIRDTNFDGVQRIGVVESKWDGKGQFTFPRHSFTLLRWKVGA